MKPLYDKVVIAPKEPESTTTSGFLVVPDSAKEIPNEGVVAAIGPDVTAVKVGDHVLFDKYAGVDIDGKLVMPEKYLLAVVEQD